MSNALVSAPAGNVAAHNPFLDASDGVKGAMNYVKFTGASGQFTSGQDEDVIEHGTRMPARIEDAFITWSFWWDGEVLEQFDVKIVDDPKAFDNEPDYLPDGFDEMALEDIRQARKDDPANFRDGWSVTGNVEMFTVEGEAQTYLFRFNAGVALSAFLVLMKAFGRLYQLKPGMVPVVELNAEKFEVKKKGVGKRWAPRLKIVSWVNPAELMGDDGGDDPSNYEGVEGPADVPALAPPSAGDAPAEEGGTRRGMARRGARFG